MMIIGWVQGDGLVGRQLAAQARGPEFKSLESISTMDTVAWVCNIQEMGDGDRKSPGA